MVCAKIPGVECQLSYRTGTQKDQFLWTHHQKTVIVDSDPIPGSYSDSQTNLLTSSGTPANPSFGSSSGNYPPPQSPTPSYTDPSAYTSSPYQSAHSSGSFNLTDPNQYTASRGIDSDPNLYQQTSPSTQPYQQNYQQSYQQPPSPSPFPSQPSYPQPGTYQDPQPSYLAQASYQQPAVPSYNSQYPPQQGQAYQQAAYPSQPAYQTGYSDPSQQGAYQQPPVAGGYNSQYPPQQGYSQAGYSQPPAGAYPSLQPTTNYTQPATYNPQAAGQYGYQDPSRQVGGVGGGYQPQPPVPYQDPSQPSYQQPAPLATYNTQPPVAGGYNSQYPPQQGYSQPPAGYSQPPVGYSQPPAAYPSQQPAYPTQQATAYTPAPTGYTSTNPNDYQGGQGGQGGSYYQQPAPQAVQPAAAATSFFQQTPGAGTPESSYSIPDKDGHRYVIAAFMTCEHKFIKMWDDRNTLVVPHPVSIYRPDPPKGWYILGDLAQRSHDPIPNAMTRCIVVKDPPPHPNYPPVLAPPDDFIQVWPVRGVFQSKFGGFVIWRPIPPRDYEALGYVTSYSSDPPSKDIIRCVHVSALESAHAVYEEDNRPIWKNGVNYFSFSFFFLFLLSLSSFSFFFLSLYLFLPSLSFLPSFVPLFASFLPSFLSVSLSSFLLPISF